MNITTLDDLKLKLDRREPIKLVMTLSDWHFRIKHIPNSIQISTPAEALARLSPDDEIILYCTNPACVASVSAYDYLRAHGYRNVSRFAGGIEAWEAAGLPLAGEV